MAVPILLAGLAVAAGVIGAGGHMSAKETNARAQSVADDAQRIYNDAKQSLEKAQKDTEEKLVKLGYEKKNVLDTSMKQFLNSYDKVKHIQVKESVYINEISEFSIEQQDALQIREMTNIYSQSFASSVAGAAAGSAIALAASGILPVVTGELALAGTAFTMGEIGMAAGFASSALSFGAAMTPLAAVAAPALLFTGISASFKADENLEKANTMYAEAELAVEKMKISETLCGAISEKSEMFEDLLKKLNPMFAECTALMDGVVRKKMRKAGGGQLKAENFTEEELKLIAVARALAGAVKTVIDTPILSEKGDISAEAEKVYDQTVEKLPDFNQAVEEVKVVKYDVLPEKQRREEKNADKPLTVPGGARRVASVVAGIIAANIFAGGIAGAITIDESRFLIFDAYMINELAVWIVICASVIMCVGKWSGGKLEKACIWGTGSSLFVLYIQYCRTVEQMDHYIIFTLVVLGALSAIHGWMDENKDKWYYNVFIAQEVLTMTAWPFLFLIYAFFSRFFGFSEMFCLVATSLVMFTVSPMGFVNTVKEK